MKHWTVTGGIPEAETWSIPKPSQGCGSNLQASQVQIRDPLRWQHTLSAGQRGCERCSLPSAGPADARGPAPPGPTLIRGLQPAPDWTPSFPQHAVDCAPFPCQVGHSLQPFTFCHNGADHTGLTANSVPMYCVTDSTHEPRPALPGWGLSACAAANSHRSVQMADSS
jgi:hypothetical protein